MSTRRETHLKETFKNQYFSDKIPRGLMQLHPEVVYSVSVELSFDRLEFARKRYCFSLEQRIVRHRILWKWSNMFWFSIIDTLDWCYLYCTVILWRVQFVLFWRLFGTITYHIITIWFIHVSNTFILLRRWY